MPKKKYTKEERIAGRKAASRRYYLKRKAYYSSPEYAEKRRLWRLADLDNHLNRCRAYKEKHRERLLEKSKQYRKENAAEYAKKRKQWREKNITLYKKWVNNWKARNCEKVYEYNVNKRKQIRDLLHHSANKISIGLICSQAKRLTKETGIIHHVDHIIPVNSGGWHHESNLQALPIHLNGSAGKWHSPFWLAPSPEYKDWRDVPRYLWPIDLAPKYLELIEKHKGVSIRWDAAA